MAENILPMKGRKIGNGLVRALAFFINNDKKKLHYQQEGFVFITKMCNSKLPAHKDIEYKMLHKRAFKSSLSLI
jgi:hemerythrin-like domain-containing protein